MIVSQMSQPFFKLLTLLTEVPGGGTGLPCFTQLVLARLWDVAEYAAHPTLEWLTSQAPRNKLVHSWLLDELDSWVQHFLIANTNQRVRSGPHHLFFTNPLPPQNNSPDFLSFFKLFLMSKSMEIGQVPCCVISKNFPLTTKGGTEEVENREEYEFLKTLSYKRAQNRVARTLENLESQGKKYWPWKVREIQGIFC